MSLPVSTIAAIREWVGDVPDDDALEAEYDRNAKSVLRTARAILRTRLANLTRRGGSVRFDGFYARGSTADQVKALRAQLAELNGLIGSEDGKTAGGVRLSKITRQFIR